MGFWIDREEVMVDDDHEVSENWQQVFQSSDFSPWRVDGIVNGNMVIEAGIRKVLEGRVSYSPLI